MTVYSAVVEVTYPPRIGRITPKRVTGWGETEEAAIAAALLEAIRDGGLSWGMKIEVKTVDDHMCD